MELACVTKKKKRRSRKCLDEIRKRSRRMMRGVFIGQTSEQSGKLHKAKEAQTYNRLVTMNRLTLNMFPKAIRSETITRPILEEIKQQSSIQENLNICKLSNNCTRLAKTPAIECFEQCNSASSTNSMPLFASDDILINDDPTKDIPLGNCNHNNLSQSHNGVEESPKDRVTKLCSATTSIASHTSEGDSRNELYEEFMDQITSHLNKITSSLIKEDVLQTTKTNLQNLHNKCRNIEYESEENSLQIITQALSSDKESIVQNPLKYLRGVEHEQRRQHRRQRGLHDGCRPTRSERFSEAGALLTSGWTQSASCPQTQSLSPPSSSSPQDNVITYDTPEYNYYPHKLNN